MEERRIFPFEEGENVIERENLFIPPSQVYQKLHPSYSSICFTCCCPCLLLGQLRSLIERDETTSSNSSPSSSTSSPSFTSLISFLYPSQIGKYGCQECLLTTPMCLICWPCSPLLSYYLYSHENKLQAIYNQNMKQYKSFSDSCYQLIFWPLSLIQQKHYLEKKKSDGLLHYKWAYHIPPHQNCRPSQISNDVSVLILGPPKCGKTELLMKLTGRRISNYDEPSFSSDEIRIGLKESFLSNQQLHVTEFWDIPATKLESISHITTRIRYVLLLYDCNNRESFKRMKEIFSDVYCLSPLSSASYICIATKDDYQFIRTTQSRLGGGGGGGEGGERDDEDEGGEREGDETNDENNLLQLMSHKRKKVEDLGPCCVELKAGSDWARERGFRYIPVSSRYNYGISAILRAIRK